MCGESLLTIKAVNHTEPVRSSQASLWLLGWFANTVISRTDWTSCSSVLNGFGSNSREATQTSSLGMTATFKPHAKAPVCENERTNTRIQRHGLVHPDVCDRRFSSPAVPTSRFSTWGNDDETKHIDWRARKHVVMFSFTAYSGMGVTKHLLSQYTVFIYTIIRCVKH